MPWIEMADRPPQTPARPREPRAWFEFRNATGDDAELLIFDEIGGWFGLYADEFAEQLAAVTAPRLTLRLNSPGGSVFEGVAIANALRAHPAQVTVRVEGLAASIASVVALAGDRLIMAPNSMFMIHDASGGCWGQAADMRQMAEVLGKISDNIADAYAARAGGTRAKWRERMLAETWYTAAEAVEAGLADELMVPPRHDDEPDDATGRMTAQWDLGVFRYAGRENAPPTAPTAVDPHESDTEATPTESPRPPLTPITAHPHPRADNQPKPPPAPPAEPGPTWAELITHLTAPPSAEDLLAHLREA